MFGAGPVDSAKVNLAVSFVNGFVNAGFRKDKLLTLDDGINWVFKHKDHGQCATALRSAWWQERMHELTWALLWILAHC